MFCREEGDRRLKKRGNSSISAIGIGHHLVVNNSDDAVVNLTLTKRHIPRVRWMCRAGNAGDAGTRLAPRSRRRSNGERLIYTVEGRRERIDEKEPNVGPTLVVGVAFVRDVR